MVFVSGICPIPASCQQPAWIENLASQQTDIEELDTDNVLIPWGKEQLDLNSATATALANLHILSPVELNALLKYRENSGPFMSIYELQAVPDLKATSIRDILPYVKVIHRRSLFDKITPLRIKKHQIQFRWRKSITVADQNTVFPYSRFFRYDYNNQYNIRGAALLESDAGESPSQKDNFLGFDHASAFVELREVNSWFKRIFVGDHQIHLGQGLTYSLGFQLGKTLQVSRINRSGPTIKANRSLDENRFHRGLAGEIKISPHCQLILFYSRMRLDATIHRSTDGVSYFRSVNNSGYHRDSIELSRKHQLPHRLSGFRFSWATPGRRLSLNALSQTFGIQADPGNDLRHLFSFRGKVIQNVSIDYQWAWGNTQIFGELAFDHKLNIAQVHGLLIPAHPRLDLGIHLRSLSSKYLNFRAQPFADGSRGNNERGWFVSMTYRINDHWQINAFIDYWTRPWLSYRRDQPSRGRSYRFRIQHQKRHKYQFYVQASVDSDLEEEVNGYGSFSRWPVSSRFKYFQAFQLDENWEWRTRVHYNMVISDDQVRSSGWLFAQDLLFRPMLFPLSFTARIAWFNTSDFDSRVYVYENNVLNAFSIPAYQGRGYRYYLNVRGKIKRSLTLEARLAATRQLPLIYSASMEGSNHSLTLQVRWSF